MTEYQPTVVKRGSRPRDAAQRFPLFTIVDESGNPTEYSIPWQESAGLAMRFMKLARTEGQAAASIWLLEEMIGTEGFDALTAEDSLTMPDLNRIGAACSAVVTGKTPPPVEGIPADDDGDGPDPFAPAA